MNRHLTIALTLLLWPLQPAVAQHASMPQAGSPMAAAAEGIIAGVVVDAAGAPLRAAAITVRSAMDSTIVTGGMVGTNGRFQIRNLPPGRYLVRASLIGYSPRSLAPLMLAMNATVDVGRITLELAPVVLEGISAEAARAPVVLEPDRTVYDTRKLPASEGGSATDVLRQVDELEVDANGRVTMRGDRAVAIHINGRPARMKGDQLREFLSTMPGRAVARVEVLPNPSAQYDPEGMGGIVNIVLRDDANLGLSGSLGANLNTNRTVGVNSRVALQHGKLTLFGGGSVMTSSMRNQGSDVRQSLAATPFSYKQDFSNRFSNVIGFGDFSAEYRLRQSTVSWINGYLSAHAHESDGLSWDSVYGSDRAFTDWYSRSRHGETPHSFVDIGTGLRHTFAANHDLTADMRWTGNFAESRSRSERTRSMDPAMVGEIISQEQDERTETWTLRADYRRSWQGLGELSAGISLSARTLDEDAERLNTAMSLRSLQRFDYQEKVRALYVNASRRLAGVLVQAGVRGEAASTAFTVSSLSEQFGSDYRSLFPSINLAYEFDRARTVRLGYSKRVGRPPVEHVNPVRYSDDPRMRIEGNPYLGPNYTHMLNLDFSWIGTAGTLRLSPYYRQTVDHWESVRTLDENGVVHMTWANTAENQQVGTTVTLSRPASRRVGASVNAGAFYNTIDATNLELGTRRSSLRWSAGSTATVRISPLSTGTFSFNYMAPRDLPQGRMSGMTNSSIGLRQQVLGNRATVNFFMNDPLNLARFRFQARDPLFAQSTRTMPSMRAANLTISYNFGKLPQQQSRRESETPQSP